MPPDEFDRPNVVAKRQFKRLKIRALSLVDEPCMWGADAVVIKARDKTSPTDRESREDSLDQALGGAFGDEVAKRLKPFADLTATNPKLTEYRAQAMAMRDTLTREAEIGTEPVAKRAAGYAAALITETMMTLAELEAALAVAEGKVVTAEGQVAVQKARADKAEGTLATLATTVATLEAEVTKARTAKPLTEAEQEEEVLKGASPALRDMVLKARAEAKANKDKADAAEAETVEKARKAEVTELVAKMKPLGVNDSDKVAEAVVAIRKGKSKPEDAEVITKALEAAAKVAGASGIYRPRGSTEAVEFDGDPEAILKARANDLKAASKGTLTYEAAYTQAMTENPQAYDALVAKSRQTVN